MTELVTLVGIIALVAIVALAMRSPFRGKVTKGGIELDAGSRQSASSAKRARKKK